MKMTSRTASPVLDTITLTVDLSELPIGARVSEARGHRHRPRGGLRNLPIRDDRATGLFPFIPSRAW